jgi:hypothetical protein
MDFMKQNPSALSRCLYERNFFPMFQSTQLYGEVKMEEFLKPYCEDLFPYIKDYYNHEIF